MKVMQDKAKLLSMRSIGKFIFLVNALYLSINTGFCASTAAAPTAPLKYGQDNLVATAPFSYAFNAPLNAIQHFSSSASNPNSLRGSVKSAFDNIIPHIIKLPPQNPILIPPALINSTLSRLSQVMVEKLAISLSPDQTNAVKALTEMGATETDALTAFNSFQTLRTTLTANVATLSPDSLIFVPLPTQPGLEKCNTILGDAPTLEQIVTVIRKTYYNQENLSNFAVHVKDRHIGTDVTSDMSASRFNAENIHAAMNYVRFVLNLITNENLILNIIQKYESTTHLLDNVVYIKYQKNAAHPEKCDIIIYYQFPYDIGRERRAPAGSKRNIRIVLGSYSEKTSGKIKKESWHFKTAFPIDHH